ncbi:hypothetical protein [Nocardia sp. NBC_01329]|uniref:hypothetical protein n=1 Tax=Nocardia sp. NBC_01329 TaxID=2903594 RepID=UPI002E109ED4|nr:hypothetical protein OG405_02780 [Nocardia sp. NBC_01329]
MTTSTTTRARRAMRRIRKADYQALLSILGPERTPPEILAWLKRHEPTKSRNEGTGGAA